MPLQLLRRLRRELLTSPSLKIGARGSPLSLAQTGLVAQALAAAHPGLVTEIIPIQTTGDRLAGASLAQIGGKGLFVKEIEEALLAGRIDLAVHSAKDLPAELPPGLALGAVPERADFRDVLITARPGGLAALPPGSRVGTSGLRRQAQLLAARPDLRIEPLRGNVATRLKKLAAGLGATLLAAAGLTRLGLWPDHAECLPAAIMLPAAGQGALALEIRALDQRLGPLLEPLNHLPSALALAAERGFLAALGSGCQLPVAALAQWQAGRLTLTALIASPDGGRVERGQKIGEIAAAGEAAACGQSLAAELLESGGREILRELSR
ncbi:MAG: hydroxymethylbilane synthase [Candidatus Adiutrix sp.]|nr:hydroxymethylbilane synthase [Candidatus Adiutrix sp.]